MNPDTATVSELRDELARLMGWFRPHLSKPMPFKWYHDTHGGQNNHPVPLTLDFVATAEERGRWIAVTFWAGHDPPRWTAQSHAGTCEGPDEITARLRLVVKVRSRT